LKIVERVSVRGKSYGEQPDAGGMEVVPGGAAGDTGNLCPW
jgi:hypothetical protein